MPDHPPAHKPGELAAALRSLGPAAVLGGLWLVLPALGGLVLLAKSNAVGGWLTGLGPLAGPIVYASIFVFTSGVGVLPTYAQAFIGGWAFGTTRGSLAALAGFVGASVIGRLIAQRVGRGRVESTLQANPKAAAVRDEMLRAGEWRTLGLVTLIRFPPNSPFAAGNLALGTTGVPWWSYLLGTAVGLFPRTLLVVSLGDQVEGALRIQRPGAFVYGGIAVTVAALLVLVWLSQRAIDRVTGRDRASDQEPAQEPVQEAGQDADPLAATMPQGQSVDEAG